MLRIPIMKGYELDTMIQKSCKFLRQCQIGYGPDGIHQCTVAINPKIPFVLLLTHLRGNHTDHPDHAQQMICMLMGQKNMMDLLHGNASILKLAHNTIAAACIYKKIFIIILNCKTSIITSGHKGIACSQHNQSFHLVMSHSYHSGLVTIQQIHSYMQKPIPNQLYRFIN